MNNNKTDLGIGIFLIMYAIIFWGTGQSLFWDTDKINIGIQDIWENLFWDMDYCKPPYKSLYYRVFNCSKYRNIHGRVQTTVIIIIRFS